MGVRGWDLTSKAEDVRGELSGAVQEAGEAMWGGPRFWPQGCPLGYYKKEVKPCGRGRRDLTAKIEDIHTAYYRKEFKP